MNLLVNKIKEKIAAEVSRSLDSEKRHGNEKRNISILLNTPVINLFWRQQVKNAGAVRRVGVWV